MEMSVKEEAKAAFGFTSVPFYVVVNKVCYADEALPIPSFYFSSLILIFIILSFPADDCITFLCVQRGEVIGAGEPKAVDYKALLAASDEESAENKANCAPITAPEQQAGLVFDEDF
jgi:hypothetical protein